MSYSGESGRKATAENIINRINNARNNVIPETIEVREGDENRSFNWDNKKDRQYVRELFAENGPIDEAILPGFGPEGHAGNARDDCGESHPFLCNECGHSVEFGRTCSQSVCGRCGVAWVRDTAINKSAKTRRVRKEKDWNTHDREHQKLHHGVLSAPLSWYADLAKNGYTLKEAQKKTKAVVKDVLDELRAPGVLVRHSYRGARDDGSIKSENDDRGAWKERLNSDREWYGDVREQLAWMPHYHIIAVADYLKGGDLTNDVEEATGWVFHRIANEETSVSLETDAAMARALTYCLSHADIDVRDGYNRSCVWEIGSFEGDPIKSTNRFSAQPADLSWADACVRKIAPEVLGLSSGSTDCGATIPPVDEPDELARRIIEELYPQDEPPEAISTDAVLHHVHEGNISVDVSTNSGGGGNVTVRDAFGTTVDNGWGGFDAGTWSTPSSSSASTTPIESPLANDAHTDCAGNCDGNHDTDADQQLHDHDHDRDDDQDNEETECDGKLIPLGEARAQGLLDDPEWCRDAAHVDEARETDLEWPDDLERWKAEQPDWRSSIGTEPPDTDQESTG